MNRLRLSCTCLNLRKVGIHRQVERKVGGYSVLDVHADIPCEVDGGLFGLDIASNLLCTRDVGLDLDVFSAADVSNAFERAIL